eukprot:CAMPEP_0204598238 /NCGR_PEP_ID=MMETSP0661-20131031/54212_1 /ASSEMBLY_ACC=CAM_ASM_000606 /TAXON_ID=109239 /ORGANISM="Alexandrium margalefi, Strain AMGDE01CS-322" /LENGTH=236 /DNA_ID=CAMNT_0051608941 /DNA_START=147 /DNA_END=858 /DNA_ORIENTATION=-
MQALGVQRTCTAIRTRDTRFSAPLGAGHLRIIGQRLSIANCRSVGGNVKASLRHICQAGSDAWHESALQHCSDDTKALRRDPGFSQLSVAAGPEAVPDERAICSITAECAPVGDGIPPLAAQQQCGEVHDRREPHALPPAHGPRGSADNRSVADDIERQAAPRQGGEANAGCQPLAAPIASTTAHVGNDDIPQLAARQHRVGVRNPTVPPARCLTSAKCHTVEENLAVAETWQCAS